MNLTRLGSSLRRRFGGVAVAVAAVASFAPLGALGQSAPTPSPATPTPVADPSVHIRLSLDDKGRLLVRYTAPAAVTELTFVDRGDRLDAVRRSLMVPADACGALSATGLTLSHADACRGGATFLVTPRRLDRPAMYEPAEPTSDQGVLAYTGAYAAVAAGRPLRWEFVPPPSGYVVDEGRRHVQEITVDVAAIAELPAGRAPLDDEAVARLHASHDVYLGRSPFVEQDGLLLVRDPALPPALVATLTDTARDVVAAYTTGSGVRPAGPIGIVMIRGTTPAGGGFHGDRSDGRMIRLSFVSPEPKPRARDLETWRHFVAHEVAHLWNHGVWSSDQATPWLHEGDAEWISWTTLARVGLLSPEALAARLDSAVNECLVARGAAPSATLAAGWESHDDPYACGFALQLLAWARRPDPAGPLAGWTALHQGAPVLTVDAFVAYADGGAAALRPDAASRAPGIAAPRVDARSRRPGARPSAVAPVTAARTAPGMATLLRDPRAPFDETYLRLLAERLPLAFPSGEPDATPLREQLAIRLFASLMQADCGAQGFTPRPDDMLLDAGLRCQHLPSGKRVTSIAGESLLAHPVAAWRAVSQACALHATVPIGFADALDDVVACPAALPPAPRWVQLPADTPARLHLVATSP